MSKLTLSIDHAVVEKAKRYAKSRRVSVSKLVEGYLDLVSKSFQTPAATPGEGASSRFLNKNENA